MCVHLQTDLQQALQLSFGVEIDRLHLTGHELTTPRLSILVDEHFDLRTHLIPLRG